MKLSIQSVMLCLGIALGVTAFAAENKLSSLDSAKCAIDSTRQSATSAVVSCANGQTFEIRQIVNTNGSCSGSIWCSAFEHCVDHQCVPKDAFHQCDAFHTCEFGAQCVDGVCGN